MSTKTNYEKMLAEEEYFPDAELADLEKFIKKIEQV